MYPYTQHLLAALKVDLQVIVSQIHLVSDTLPWQDLLAINPEGPKYIPFEYQLNLFDAIGALVGAGSQQDQIAFLEVPSAFRANGWRIL